MPERLLGLAAVPTPDLRKALAALHRGELACPLTITELTRFGLQHVALDLLSHLRGLDAVAVRAVLVAVLAERMAAARGASQAVAGDDPGDAAAGAGGGDVG